LGDDWRRLDGKERSVSTNVAVSVGVQSVDRACALLHVLGRTPGGAPLGQLSRDTGLHKSTARRILLSLVAAGLVRQAPPDDHYRLGAALPHLGDVARLHLFDGNVAHSILRTLRDQTNETVHLGVLDRFELVYVDKIESLQSLQVASRIGARAPLYCTGLGKAYLAHMPEGWIARYLVAVELAAKTPNTITDRAALLEDLAKTRKRGWSVDDVENEADVRCIGAPVLDSSGTVVAAVSVTAPASRLTMDKVPQAAALLLNAARGLGDSSPHYPAIPTASG
jgi:DNA-binding IclR family transcriptional regulator